MSVNKTLIKELEEESNIRPIRPALEQDPPWYGEDWLRALPEGTVFLSRTRVLPRKIFLDKWLINIKLDKAIQLISYLEEEEEALFVDSKEFSDRMEFIETIGDTDVTTEDNG